MAEPLKQDAIIDIYRQRFEGIIGQPVWFYAADTMVNPKGDMSNVPLAGYQRIQSDGAETGLLIQGMVESVSEDFTPQYLKDPTQSVWVVHLRHTEVATVKGGHHLLFANNGPRSATRLDRIYGWYESTEDQAPEARGLAA